MWKENVVFESGSTAVFQLHDNGQPKVMETADLEFELKDTHFL